MEITDLGPGGFASCCYLVSEGTDAVLIDCSAPPETVAKALEARGARLQAILCTHGHFDHILTADAVRDHFGVPLFMHEADAELPTDGQKNAFAAFFGFERAWRAPERTFTDGETLTLGTLTLRVMHTPGHTRGSSVFFTDGVLFSGDTLFVGGFGRTDLYGGDHRALTASLRALSALPPATMLYPGHGESGTLSLVFKQSDNKN